MSPNPEVTPAHPLSSLKSGLSAVFTPHKEEHLNGAQPSRYILIGTEQSCTDTLLIVDTIPLLMEPKTE